MKDNIAIICSGKVGLAFLSLLENKGLKETVEYYY